MAEELGHRIRYGTPAKHVKIASPGCVVTTATGEHFESDAVVSALPVGRPCGG
jgi:monoamine oxidase